MSTTARIIIVICLAFAVTGGYFVLSAKEVNAPAVTNVPNGPITVQGQIVCLPHKDNKPMQSTECAFGLKDIGGRLFALQDSDAEYKNISSVPFNTDATVDGTFEARADSKYQSIGTILVSKVSRKHVPVNTYSNTEYGISFTYPNGFALTESEVGNKLRKHHTVVITKQTNAALPINGEGPVAVTIDVYQNNIDKQGLIEWVTSSAESNFKIGPGTFASTTVSGNEAVHYTWSGLYEGETIAFIHNENIVALSGTHDGPEDEIVAVYQQVAATLKAF